MSEPNFELRIVFRANVLASADKARAFLDVLRTRGGDLAPTRFSTPTDAKTPFEPDAVVAAIDRPRGPPDVWLANDLGVSSLISAYGRVRDPGSALFVDIPLSVVRGRGDQIIELADALCRASAPLLGRSHLEADVKLAKDPNWTSASAPQQLHQAYWLTILGPALVRQIGAGRVASTPAYRVEMYKNGGALVVTTRDPAQVLSPTAREAQARATAHLRSGVDEAQLRATSLDRTAKLAAAPVPTPARVIAEPSEWRPSEEALASDVDDPDAASDRYSDDAEDFIAGFHADIEGLTRETADSFRHIDEYLLMRDYWHDDPPGQAIALLVPAIGAYVGTVMVNKLDGRWVSRRNPDETAVIVGDRAWHPFLRVRRMFASPNAMLAHPLSLFYEAAARGHTDGLAP
jgi:hypothetical protein